jgi:hypothetical protein
MKRDLAAVNLQQLFFWQRNIRKKVWEMFSS